ncbi:MAG TPA: DegV family protein [Anaerolineales bacterium]|nr:DegV family protein [Anaerolineales bacterium]
MVVIVADTTCGLPRDLLEQRGIPLIPQIITLGEKYYHDDEEIDTPKLLRMMQDSPLLPRTSAPGPIMYYSIFGPAAERGDSVVVVAPSMKVSGTIRSAQTAALDFPNVDIRVVDTQTVSCNLGSLVLLADDLAKTGRSADEIVQKLNDMIPRGRLYFLVNTLEYLAKGGRIGGAKNLLAELLQLKPILQVKNGQVEPFEQQRTKRRALARLVEVTAEGCRGGEEAHLCVIQVAAEKEAQSLVEELQSKIPVSNIPIYELPPAIVVHSGPGALGVGFFE